MSIQQFLSSERFDPDTTRMMGVAFEMACVALRLAGRGAIAKAVVAEKIIELAKAGERDANTLCEHSLKELRANALENRLLAALEPSDYALLMPQLRTAYFSQGAVLQEQDAPVAHVYFPMNGLVSLVSIMEDGQAVESAVVGREGAVGAFAGLRPCNAFARATVQIPATVAVIPTSHFQAAVNRSERIRDLILRYKEALLGQVQQTAACNALHPLEARLARWLVQAFDRTGDARDLPLTQESIAQMLGARRTTVTLIARRLQDAGLISYRRGRIIILDKVGLEHLACECYRASRRLTERVLPATDESARKAHPPRCPEEERIETIQALAERVGIASEQRKARTPKAKRGKKTGTVVGHIAGVAVVMGD
jgi:CRP-like cAMP-binding protein